MASVAQWVVLISAVWLAGLGLYIFLSPDRALRALAAMGSTPAIHFGELGIRAAVGLAFIAAAPLSRAPTVTLVLGAFLTATAAVLMLVPRRWHSTYSQWWAARIPEATVPILGSLAVVGGAALLWSAL